LFSGSRKNNFSITCSLSRAIVISLLGGTYRIIDMGLTTMNVLGTVFVTVILGHLENARATKAAQAAKAREARA
jgi:Na+/H+-dicarboxylate symporter